jgi:hypothetical protein
VLNSKTLKTLILFILMISRPVLSKPNVHLVSKWAGTSVREPVDEPDATDTGDCFSLGELDISFRTDNDGPPNVGVVLTDPRGRHIGFDPLTKQSWQQLPVAQAYIDCDDLDGNDSCRGLVQICGALSGAYELEIISQQTATYDVSVFARSKEFLERNNFQSYHSETELNSIPIREGSRDTILLKYSRDLHEKVAGQLQPPVNAKDYDTGVHLQADEKAVRK